MRRVPRTARTIGNWGLDHCLVIRAWTLDIAALRAVPGRRPHSGTTRRKTLLQGILKRLFALWSQGVYKKKSSLWSSHQFKRSCARSRLIIGVFKFFEAWRL